MADRGRGRGGRRPYWMFKKKNDAPTTEILNKLKDDTDILLQPPVCPESPYVGWRLYFPEEKYVANSETAVKIKGSVKFFKEQLTDTVRQEVEEKQFMCFDFKALTEDKNLLLSWKTLATDLSESPKFTLNILSLSLHHVVNERAPESGLESRIIQVRILNFEPVVPLKTLKAGLFGKLVTVRGTVIRVGSRKLMCSSLGFGCSKCGTKQVAYLKDGTYKTPKSCTNDDCKSKAFTPLCSSMLTKSRPCQVIKIQEIITDDQREGGRVPRTVECELADDLVEMCTPGDSVTLTAIVKVNNPEETSKKNKGANLFSLYLEVVSLVNSKGSSGRSQGIGVEFSLQDYYAIQEIHNEPSQFRLLVNSLCPSVYGHEMVKAGLLLGLVGGAGAAHSHSGNTRGDIHILVVGDPGLGKSHMLHSCSSVAPRGVYVCGNTASTSGLTVTLCKESGGDYALEAGALVLANQGVCCIDEFDKMSTQHLALLEAMEQQSVSIAKGGVVCTLPARTSILAAANPSGGHYNRAKTVSENLKISQPLLSRFDLVFILLDKPNEELDYMLSEHVMGLHSRTGNTSKLDLSRSFLDGSTCHDQTESLSSRLIMKPNERNDLIPQLLLRKYIAYVRKYVPFPTLSSSAFHVLQNFYLELREKYQSANSTPVTTRQLESLIRLTQARAKVELREEASESDALDVIELMRWSIKDTLTDETGALDKTRGRNGSGMSQASQSKKLIRALQRIYQVEGKKLFNLNEIKDIGSRIGLQVPNYYSLASNLNLQGFLLKKGNNLYQLLVD